MVQHCAFENQIKIRDSHYLEVKNEFSNYLQQFQSEKCLVQIFSNNSDCEEIDDSLKNLIAYDMTKCIFTKVGKTIPYCSGEDHNIRRIYNCIRVLENDAWTTYITVSQHIENMCYYFKAYLKEKSSDFIFEKLLNSSNGILLDLKSSSDLAKDMMLLNQKLTNEIQQNLTLTMGKFENFDQFFKNYSSQQEKIQTNLNQLESKILIGFNQLTKVENAFGNFISIKDGGLITNTFKFYFTVLFIEICIWIFIYEQKLIYIFFDFVFIFGERYCFVHLYKHPYYFIILLIYRISLLILVFIYTYSKYSEKKKRPEKIKQYLNETPSWVRKYFLDFRSGERKRRNCPSSPYSTVGKYDLLRSKNRINYD